MFLYPEWNDIFKKGSPEKDSNDDWTNQEDTQQVFGLHFLPSEKRASVFLLDLMNKYIFLASSGNRGHAKAPLRNYFLE